MADVVAFSDAEGDATGEVAAHPAADYARAPLTARAFKLGPRLVLF